MITVYTHFYMDPGPDQRHLAEHALGRRLLSCGLRQLYGSAFSRTADSLAEDCMDTIPDDLLKMGPYGKPILAAHPDICFNISHCNGLVVCAFCDSPVGVDVEPIRPFKENLLHRVLTVSEQALLNASANSDSVRQEWFFRFWTLKESCIKQSGTGMSVPLTDFFFSFPADGSIHCSIPGLHFEQTLLTAPSSVPPAVYVLSACSASDSDVLRIVPCSGLDA